ncbi:membrane protein UL20 [Panine betaherpesvirus 2]|uniref:Membrane protein UL20 n=1 Tax=Panine betaherpesvirus 2 TaxID=188763 RepID=Q8QS68_9BETA|nr:membrane protein UL20 [Panine betaherpesvirus 2]AAM00670.1 membrane protein UL20 [Panine betaherpesvirus 2]QXV67772.1 membrane protein UL20 [Panine betaherpesvirus 2]
MARVHVVLLGLCAWLTVIAASEEANGTHIFVSLLTGDGGFTRTAIGGLNLTMNYTNLLQAWNFTNHNQTNNNSMVTTSNLTRTCVKYDTTYVSTIWIVDCNNNSSFWYKGNAYNHSDDTNNCSRSVSAYLQTMCQTWQNFSHGNVSNVTQMEYETRCMLPKKYSVNATAIWYGDYYGDNGVPNEFMEYGETSSLITVTCSFSEAVMIDEVRYFAFIAEMSFIGITGFTCLITTIAVFLILICYCHCNRLLVCPRGFQMLKEYTEEEEQSDHSDNSSPTEEVSISIPGKTLTSEDIQVQVPINPRRLLIPWVRGNSVWGRPPPLPPRPPHLRRPSSVSPAEVVCVTI